MAAWIVVLVVVVMVVLAGLGLLLTWGTRVQSGMPGDFVTFRSEPSRQCNTSRSGLPSVATFYELNVTVLSDTWGATTDDFGLTITCAGTGCPFSFAQGSTVGTGSCPGANPDFDGGTIAVLSSPSGVPQAYLTGNNTWVALGSTELPSVLAVDYTISVISGNLWKGATLSVFGLNGVDVSGTATLP